MYYEEMALGYCWAEYFLQLGKNMETMSMYPATLSHSNFGGVEDKRPRQTKGGTLVRDTSKDWIASSQRPRKHVRRKRSSGISSATGGTSILGKRVRKSDEMRPPVQKSAKSIDCHWHASRHIRGDKRREFSAPASVMSPFSLSSLSNASGDTNLEGLKSEGDEGRPFGSKLANLKFMDYYLANPSIQRDKRELSNFNDARYTSLLDIYLALGKVILKISENVAKSESSGKNSAISAHMEFESNSRSANPLVDFLTHKNRRSSNIDVKESSISFPRSTNRSQKISKARKKPVQEFSAGKSASSKISSKASSKAGKVYLESIEGSRRSSGFTVEDVRRSSLSLSSSPNIFTEDDRLPIWNGEKVVKAPFDSKFKGSRAESDREVSGKSGDLEGNTRRKLLYPETSHVTSAGFTRRGFSIKVFHLRDQESTVGQSFGKMLSLEDSGDTEPKVIEVLNDEERAFRRKREFNLKSFKFQGMRNIEKSKDEDKTQYDDEIGDFRYKRKFKVLNPELQKVGYLEMFKNQRKLQYDNEKGDLRYRREFELLNSEFQEAEHLEVFKSAEVQKNPEFQILKNRIKVRSKRDTSDQTDNLTRQLSVKPLKFVRYSPSWLYLTSKRNAWKVEVNIKSQINSENNEPSTKETNWSPQYFKHSFATSGSLYPNYNTSIPQTNKQSFIPLNSKISQNFKKNYNIASFTINPRNTSSANYILSKNPRTKKPDDWWKQNSYKQSAADDNRYQGAEGSFLQEISASEETGGKEAIQDPVGGPSLLPNSYPRFMGDYRRLTSGTSWNSRPSRSSRDKNQGRRSLNTFEARGPARTATLFNIREAFIRFLRTLGFFVQVGREIIDYVDSNSALSCTKDYLWSRAIQWIES